MVDIHSCNDLGRQVLVLVLVLVVRLAAPSPLPSSPGRNPNSFPSMAARAISAAPFFCRSSKMAARWRPKERCPTSAPCLCSAVPPKSG